MPDYKSSAPKRHGALSEGKQLPEQARNHGYFLEEHPFNGKLSLRGKSSDKAFLKAAANVLGADLPTTPGSTAVTSSELILWQRPDAWLIVCADGAQFELLEKLNKDLSGIHHLVTNLTDNYTTLRLSGEADLRDILKSGCYFDLHPEAFPAGAYAQSTLAEVDVLIHAVPTSGQGGEIFDIYLRRSFAAYVWAWLEKACLLAAKDKALEA